MGQARDEAGNIWETDAQGNAVRLLQPAAAQMPADPAFPYQGAQAAANSSKAGTEAQVAAATAPDTIAAAIAARRKAEADAAVAEAAAAAGSSGRPKLSPEAYSNAMQGFTGAMALSNTIAELERRYREGPGATSGLGGLADYLPLAQNERFDRAANAARGTVGDVLGFTGGQLNSAQEAQMNVGPFIPQAGDKDATILDSIERLKQLQQQGIDRSVAILGGVPDASGNIIPVPEGAKLNAMTVPRILSGGGLSAAGAGATTGAEPIDPEYQAEYTAWVTQNAGKFTPEQYAAFRSGLDQKYNYDPTADYVAEGQRIADRFAKGGTQNLNIPPNERALSGGEQFRNNLISNPLGAAAVGALDMGGFGGVSALAPDQMAALGEAQPTGMALGQIGGAIGGTAALGYLGRNTLGRALPQLMGGSGKAQFGRNLATDVGYSGIYGGTTEGDPLTGAALGGLGSAGGQVIGRGVGAAVGGVNVSPAVEALRARGIPMTVGRQLGDLTSKIEDKAASWPFVGDMIRRRGQDSYEGLSRAMFNEGGAPIGFSPSTIGREGVEQFRSAKGQAYDDATAGVSVPNDLQFETDLTNVAALRNQLPEELHPRFDRLMENHTAGIGQTGELTGEAYQRAMRGLKTARGKAGTVANEFEEPYRNAVSAGMDAFDGLMRRGGGEDVVQGLNRANAANKNFKIIEDAVVNRARNGTRAGEVGLPAPSQWVDAAAASERKYGANALRGLAEDAQRVLPSSVPNSGTTDRALAAGLGLAGLGAVGGTEAYATGDASTTAKVAAALALLTAGGTRTGQRALQTALIDRPGYAQALGRAIRKKQGLFGAATLPLALEAGF